MPAEITIPHPDPKVFENDLTPMTRVTSEDQPLLFVDHAEYPEEGGTLVYKFGGRLVDKPVELTQYSWMSGDQRLRIDRAIMMAPHIVDRVDLRYPEKGFPTPEAVIANNTAKRYFIGSVKFFARVPALLPLLLLLPNKKKALIQWLHEFRQFCKQTLGPYYWQERYYMASSRELMKFIRIFLEQLGITEEQDGFARAFGHMIEFDSAYRYRLEDILSETTAEKLHNNPRQEIVRLFTIFTQREPKAHLGQKIGYMVRIASLFLLLPKFKNAFRKALEAIDLTKLQYDDADRYHVMKYAGYDFFGQPAEQRIKEYERLTGSLPLQHQVGAFDSGTFEKNIEY